MYQQPFLDAEDTKLPRERPRGFLVSAFDAMAQPNSENGAVEYGREDVGEGQHRGSPPPSSALSESSPTQLGPSPQDNSSTTDDCMSNPDDDVSETHSVYSRQESMDDGGKEGEVSPTGADPNDGGGFGGSDGQTGQIGAGKNVEEPSRYKRPLSEEDKSAQGQLLRKACDLCTKVRYFRCLDEYMQAEFDDNSRQTHVRSSALAAARTYKIAIVACFTCLST